jgi:hypothetical protein
LSSSWRKLKDAYLGNSLPFVLKVLLSVKIEGFFNNERAFPMIPEKMGKK